MRFEGSPRATSYLQAFNPQTKRTFTGIQSRDYYKHVAKKAKKIETMNTMDRHLTKHPTEGVKSMVFLFISMGFIVGIKRIRRLFRIMGWNTILQAQEPHKIRYEGIYKVLLAQESEDYPCKHSLVYRYHQYTYEKMFYVHDNNYRCL